MAVGSAGPDNVHAELFDFVTGGWIVVSDYPFSTGSGFGEYEMLFIPEITAYCVIGGMNGQGDNIVLATIALFQNGRWSNAGRLNMARNVSLTVSLSF